MLLQHHGFGFFIGDDAANAGKKVVQPFHTLLNDRGSFDALFYQTGFFSYFFFVGWIIFPQSTLAVKYFLLPTSYSLLLTPYFLLHTPAQR